MPEERGAGSMGVRACRAGKPSYSQSLSWGAWQPPWNSDGRQGHQICVWKFLQLSVEILLTLKPSLENIDCLYLLSSVGLAVLRTRGHSEMGRGVCIICLERQAGGPLMLCICSFSKHWRTVIFIYFLLEALCSNTTEQTALNKTKFLVFT